MSSIEILSDPMPRKKSSGTSQSKEIANAMHRLEVWQCFYLPYTKETYNILSTQASYNKRITWKAFSIRKISKDAETIVGLWRIN